VSEDALITREQRGNISVLTMVYRPYNLLGPKLINAIVEQIEAARDAGSRAIVLRSGLRHFSAGADLDIFDKRVERVRRVSISPSPPALSEVGRFRPGCARCGASI
jgi:enoyl-CoA hydratase/carnithine racemase